MKIVLFCICLLYSYASLSQVYVSPIIGIDFAKIESISLEAESPKVHLLDKGYATESPVFGLKASKIISEKLFFTISSNYSTKKVNAETNGFIPINGVKFNYIKNSLTLNYWLHNYFFSAGYNFNILKNVRYIYNDNHTSDAFTNNLTESGLRISLGVIIKKFDFELYYYTGLSSVDDKSETLYLKPLSSLGVQLGYNFKILSKQKNRKGIECPEF